MSKLIASPILRGPDVSVLGGNATFRCFADGNAEIEWLVNDTAMQTFPEDNVLVLANLTLEYNMTSIRCRANTTASSVTSVMKELLIQGHLKYCGY